MTTSILAQKLNLKPLCNSPVDREVKGAYIGDLLSWVMGRAPADCAWITIMSNVNVSAVASLADVACVILAEGVGPDEQCLQNAESRGINLYSSDKTAYEIAVELAKIGI